MKKILSIVIIVALCACLPSKSIASSVKDAYKSLKRVEASTEVGVTFPKYISGLVDAKVEVNIFLDNEKAKYNSDLVISMKKAMDHYLIAGQVWRKKFETLNMVDGNSLFGKRVLELYPQIKKTTAYKVYGSNPFVKIEPLLTIIWLEASKELAKIGKLLADIMD